MGIIPERSNNDPTPKARTGDSSFLPVVIVSFVVILLLLIGAIVFIKSRKEKAVPLHSAPHTTSEIIQSEPMREKYPWRRQTWEGAAMDGKTMRVL
jgi:hypothetical protein